MNAAIFLVDYKNGMPNLPSLGEDVAGWSYWAEEEVVNPDQLQVRMHVEHSDPTHIAAMKLDNRYTFIEDVLPPESDI